MADLPPKGAPDALYIIDLPGWVHRALHAGRGDVQRAHPGLPILAGWLVRLLRDHAPAFLVAAEECDGPTWREVLYPAYKAERRAKPRPDGLTPLFTQARRMFSIHGIPVVSAPENEADDVIATLATRAAAAGLRVVIVGRDKDLGQLVTDRVLLWDGEGAPAGPDEIRARWGVPPERVVDVMALMGDSGDGVPGVSGIGEKTAGPLVAKHGSLDEVLRKWQWEPKGIAQKLRLGGHMAHLSRELVTLRRDLDLGVRLQDCALGWADPKAIRAFHLEHRFTNLAEDVGPNPKRAPTPAVIAAAAAAGWRT